MSELEEIARHDRQADRVAAAVAALLERFGPAGLGPDAIAEGAIRGGVQVLIVAGATPGEVVAVLRGMADAIEGAGDLKHGRPN